MCNKVVGYFASWSVYNQPERFVLADVNPRLFTHLIYAFAKVDVHGGVFACDPYADLPSPNCNGYGQFQALKQLNPALKTLISVGGASCASSMFSTIVANASTRRAFVDHMVAFAREHRFDGVDLDWEFPAKEGGVPADKANFALLLKEMRPKFSQHNLLMTAAVSNFGENVAASYDVPALSRYLDWINLMAYDYHGSWSLVTGQNAPLYAHPQVDTTPYSKQVNVDAGVQYWLSHGADPSKLVLGVAMYGQVFTLANAAIKGLGAPVVKTSSTPTLAYAEIVHQVSAPGWQVFWDDFQKVPYASDGRLWIGYDDPKSVAIKVSYARERRLGGVMVWSLDKDFSSHARFQLSTAIADAMGLTRRRR